MDADEALKKVGGYRFYHLTIFFCIGISSFSAICVQAFNIVFIGYEPPHHCKVPENQTLDETIPGHPPGHPLDQCHLYQNLSVDNTSVPCDAGWQYHSDGYSTIVTEWDLVCSRNFLVELSQMVYQCCGLVTELCICYLVDRVGRKTIHVCSVLGIALTGSIMALSVNFTMLVVFRCLSAVLVTAALQSGMTLMMELFDSEKRTFAGIALEGPWLVSFLPLALFAWAIPNWRHLQLILSLVNLVWIFYIWYLPESVPWLVATGKLRKAEKLLKQLAKWNHVKLDGPIHLTEQPTDSLSTQEKDGSNFGSVASHLSSKSASGGRDVTVSDVLLLFKDNILRKHIIISAILWFGNCVVYYALTLVSPMLPGNRFVNFFILAVVEIPAYIVSYFIIDRFGRRIPLFVYHILAGVPLAFMPFIPAETAGGTNLVPLSTTLMIIGKFGISSSFAVMIVITKEIFPTTLRGTSGGFCSAFGRVGSMLAPLASYTAKTSLHWLPTVICAGISILAGVLALLLPETNKKPLPQTREDVRRLYLPLDQIRAPRTDAGGPLVTKGQPDLTPDEALSEDAELDSSLVDDADNESEQARRERNFHRQP